jgi:hypothetical protein
MPEFKTQGEKFEFFTLMIPEIANQKVKISPASKTCDMSRHITTYSAIAPLFLISTCHSQTPISQPPLLEAAELSK